MMHDAPYISTHVNTTSTTQHGERHRIVLDGPPDTFTETGMHQSRQQIKSIAHQQYFIIKSICIKNLKRIK